MTETGCPSVQGKVAEAAGRFARSLRGQVPKANARPDPLFRYLTKPAAMPYLYHS
jgi:hypothetical protein